MTRDLFGTEHSTPYKDYLKSGAWKKVRKEALNRVHDICERCGRTKYSRRLEVHHRTYERLGQERPEDLVVLCTECHQRADTLRAKRTKDMQEQRLWEARLDGWATKVYGEHWNETIGYDSAQEAFEEWLENQ